MASLVYTRSSSAPSAPSLYPSSSTQTAADADADDLLLLLGADTFSLESHRDRDLLLLSSILQSALPPSSSSPAIPSYPTNHYTHAGYDNNMHSCASGSGGYQPGSFNNELYYPLVTPTVTPQGTPLGHTLPLPSTSTTAKENVGSMWAQCGSGGAGPSMGYYRPPTVSRERSCSGRRSSVCVNVNVNLNSNGNGSSNLTMGMGGLPLGQYLSGEGLGLKEEVIRDQEFEDGEDCMMEEDGVMEEDELDPEDPMGSAAREERENQYFRNQQYQWIGES